ncbi:MAG: cyclase family protein [Ignavibacteriaceae bacterium]|jgi:kynurenine formamidase|nr:cyclase family protein [Ignavibacteriaceae bacterium]
MKNKIIDLTQVLNETMPVYPGTLKPKFEKSYSIDKNGFAEINMTLVSHTGTHIDAPCHILKGARSLDRFPVEKFIGKAIVIPCEGRSEISLSYLKTFEEKIAQVAFILFYTGWQNKWGTEAYFNDCPTLTKEAAMWLTNFKLDGIGFDAFSVDKMGSAEVITSETLPNHFILLAKEILLIENLTNLDKLPDDIFMFQCLPLKIEDADGSPIRAIATFE